MEQGNERNINLDILRIIAGLMVMLVHCSAAFIVNYPLMSAEFIIGSTFKAFASLGVPLYVMLSGALLLREEKRLSPMLFYKRRLIKIFLLTVFWAFVFALVYKVIVPGVTYGSKGINAGAAIDAFLYGHYHMWFLYMLIGLYIATPFLYHLLPEKNSCYAAGFIAIAVLVVFIAPVIQMIAFYYPAAARLIIVLKSLRLNFFSCYVTYFLLGWYACNGKYSKKLNSISLYIMGTVSIAAMLLFVYNSGEYSIAYTDESLLVLLPSLCVFVAVSNASFKVNSKGKRVIAKLSRLNFGAYILHPFFNTISIRWIAYDSNVILCLLARWVVVVGMSYSFANIISEIPLLKKTIRM